MRVGVVPIEWKTANVIPLPRRNPPVSIEKDIRPISLTAKVFESIVMKCIDEKMNGKIDNKQFGGISGTSTTDVLLEMVKSKLYPLPKTRTNRYRNSFIPWGLRNCQ